VGLWAQVTSSPSRAARVVAVSKVTHLRWCWFQKGRSWKRPLKCPPDEQMSKSCTDQPSCYLRSPILSRCISPMSLIMAFSNIR
jgi:hypothetical protein